MPERLARLQLTERRFRAARLKKKSENASFVKRELFTGTTTMAHSTISRVASAESAFCDESAADSW